MENMNMQEKIDRDIEYIEEQWRAYSHDGEKMASLFHSLFHQYKKIIDGFSKGFLVAQPYENIADMAHIYRKNVETLLERLIGFRENGYSNEGLMEYYFRLERKDVDYDADFTKVRMVIGLMEGLSEMAREEVIDKLGEMEEICARAVFKREKWEALREYLVWLSGKDVDIAMALLPLFLKIS